MKAHLRQLVERCLDDGIAYGIRRAYKYEDNPAHETIADAVKSAVMLELDEWIDWEEGTEQ